MSKTRKNMKITHVTISIPVHEKLKPYVYQRGLKMYAWLDRVITRAMQAGE